MPPIFGPGRGHWTAFALPRQGTQGKTRGICNIAAFLNMKDPDHRDWAYLSNTPQVSMGYLSNRPQVSMGYLRWLDRLKNDDIRQKYDVFRNIIFKALEHLQKAF